MASVASRVLFQGYSLLSRHTPPSRPSSPNSKMVQVGEAEVIAAVDNWFESSFLNALAQVTFWQPDVRCRLFHRQECWFPFDDRTQRMEQRRHHIALASYSRKL